MNEPSFKVLKITLTDYIHGCIVIRFTSSDRTDTGTTKDDSITEPMASIISNTRIVTPDLLY